MSPSINHHYLSKDPFLLDHCTHPTVSACSMDQNAIHLVPFISTFSRSPVHGWAMADGICRVGLSELGDPFCCGQGGT